MADKKITELTAFTTPTDDDLLVGVDDPAGAAETKKITWANIKATLWAAIHAASSKGTPVDADEVPLLNSASSFAINRLTWANIKATLKAYFDTLYAPIAPKWYFLDTTNYLTSTAWDGDARSTTAKTLIDLSAVFGAPAGVKAVLVYFTVRDSGSAASDTLLVLGPTNTANKGMTASPYPVNDRPNRGSFIVPCNADGDIYYQVTASGADTFDVWLEIWGYYL